MDKILDATDYVAACHCPRASVSGYDPVLRAGTKEASEHLLAWTRSKTPWRQHASRPQAIDNWMMQTQLRVIMNLEKNGGAELPPEAENGFWLPNDRLCNHEGRLQIDSLGEKTEIEFRLPFYYESRGVGEAVYCDLGRSPMTQHEWTTFLYQACWTREAFRRMTGNGLQVRYIAPIRRVERIVQIPHSKIDRLVRHVRTSRLAPIITPGDQCNKTITKGQTESYVCPLREEGKCNPLNSS